MLGGGGAPSAGAAGGDELLTVTVQRDEHGYGMKVSGDNPVYVQSVKEQGAAWRAGLRAGDRILRVGSIPVLTHTHQQVVHMIRANPTTVLTVQQNMSRHKTPITAPLPVNSEKQRQLEVSKVHTVRLMLEQEQKYIRDLRNELTKVPDVRKQAQLESAEQRCSTLQHEIDTIMAGQPSDMGPMTPPPATPRLLPRGKSTTGSPPPLHNSGFLSGLPRSLSNLTGQSLRNLRQARQNSKTDQPSLVRQSSDETSGKRRHVHNNTVPMVPTTCLDNVVPPPLPPRSTERPKRNLLSPTLSPPLNPIAKPKPCSSASPIHTQYHTRYYPDRFPMHQSMPGYDLNQMRMSSHSLDGQLDGPQPNSIALQMVYPLINVPPPPLQTDNRGSVPVLHVRSQSSPENLDHEKRAPCEKESLEPPGTPPPPYAHNTQPCADPQRAIISMEEDDSPASDNSTYSGLFSNLRSVRESKARTAVLLNWLLGERRCACANLLLVITDGYRSASSVPAATLRRWAYEIQSTFLMPNAVLQLNGVDENMANEIEHVLVNEYEKEELLRNVFRKARQKAKEELTQQLTEFQVKRQVGLGTMYGPEDSVIEKCDVDKAQEQVVVERLMCQRLSAVAAGSAGCGAGPGGGAGSDAHQALLAALIAAALTLHCREISELEAREVRRRWWQSPKTKKNYVKPASVAAAVGGSRASFLQRDKLYKQRAKQLAKHHPQPLVVRGHHLQLQALTSVGHCHHCDYVIWGLAPQAYVCTDCKLRVHRACAKSVEEGCCLDGEHHNNRISRFMERIHPNVPNNQDSSEKKSRKASAAANFLNMERSFRKIEDEQPWDQTLTPASAQERRDESDESLYESADCHSDAISASEDAIPRLGKTPTMSKESLKLAITDEELDVTKPKKTHRKAMSLSHPLEIVKTLGDEWFDAAKKELEKNSDKRKSKESLWSEEDKDSIHGSTLKLDQMRKNSKKEDNQVNSRKSSTTEAPKSRKSSKSSSISSLNFLRRKKTPTSTIKAVEAVVEVVDKIINADELLNYTKLFLEKEKRYASDSIREIRPLVETDSDEEMMSPKQIGEQRRRLSRQTSRSKSKARGKSQTVKVNTLRKSHSGTLKKGKKKSIKTPLAGRSRQASIVEQTPVLKKKSADSFKQNSWLFSGSRGESRREGSTEEPPPDHDADAPDHGKDASERDNWRTASASSAAPSAGAGAGGARGVNRAESCRERDAPRRGKHRNASDPNRLTATHAHPHNHHDLEPGSVTAPSGSSSSSSLSSRSNESNTATVAPDQQASQSDWSEDDDPLAAQWADSLPPHVLDTLLLSSRLRKRQEVIHELIVSEASHVRWLKVLGGVFLHGLETHNPPLLPGDELRALFPNLPGVRERHAKLYQDLRSVRNEAPNHIVQIRPVADALLNTLGESGYGSCLARFCRGQRMALDALRERRRKSKELHQFLAAREQLPLCGRLQLRDLLACVWQRLTKYQLLLESILKTACDKDGDSSDEGESEEDIAILRRALDVAKDVLHSVDTAIRTAENEQRLRAIQSKLEVRIPCAGSEWDEPRRLDLTQRALRMEGELGIRNDSNKKMSVLALMLEDSLVLLQREGDKFILKPINQPSQQGLLSPLIKWEKVLFRPNAAVRNTFFLMNINGVQMHELSANTNAEYTSWVKHMQELPLAKPELKPSLTPSHQASRSTDDSGINVSRNPSDASEKSASTATADELENERDRASLERSSTERERERDSKEKNSMEREERRSEDKEETAAAEREEKHKPRRPTVGRISTHGTESAPALVEASQALTIQEPAANSIAHTAHTAYTHQERLRRLDDGITRALRAKSALVGELLGIPADSFAQLADLAIADTLGQVDVCGELRLSRLSRCSSVDEEMPPETTPDMHQLLLAAQAQANQLTESLTAALSVDEAAAVAGRVSRASRGRCDRCDRCHRSNSRRSRLSNRHQQDGWDSPSTGRCEGAECETGEGDRERRLVADYSLMEDAAELVPQAATPAGARAGVSAGDVGDVCEGSGGAAALATRLVGAACGLQGTLARLLGALPALDAERLALRRELAALREHNDKLRAKHSGYPVTEEISFPKESVDQSIQDQPSNGG